MQLEVLLTVSRKVESKVSFSNQIRKPKLSDIKLFALALTAEYLSLDYCLMIYLLESKGQFLIK